MQPSHHDQLTNTARQQHGTIQAWVLIVQCVGGSLGSWVLCPHVRPVMPHPHLAAGGSTVDLQPSIQAKLFLLCIPSLMGWIALWLVAHPAFTGSGWMAEGDEACDDQ